MKVTKEYGDQDIAQFTVGNHAEPLSANMQDWFMNIFFDDENVAIMGAFGGAKTLQVSLHNAQDAKRWIDAL